MALRHFAFAPALALSLAAGMALADELPTPKAGLWETHFLSGAPQLPSGVKQCMDGKIDLEGLLKMTGGLCDVTWKRIAADRVETSSKCKMGPISAEGQGVLSGDWSTLIRIESKTRISMDGMPGGTPAAVPNGDQAMIIEARWIGPCGPGQRGGDVIMPDGRVVNMMDMQKAAMPR